jgi:sirohydrochlorin cobaltochelatase
MDTLLHTAAGRAASKNPRMAMSTLARIDDMSEAFDGDRGSPGVALASCWDTISPMGFEAVILVGHGGIPADAPGELVSELKRLEASRRARGEAEMTAREAELDRRLREWPRAPATDPYKFGLEAVAGELRTRLDGRHLVTAYNEFCAPSVEEAIASLVSEGASRITLLTTMFTRGGSHAELEIPQIIEDMRARFPDVALEYVWPFDLGEIASFLAAHVPPPRDRG